MLIFNMLMIYGILSDKTACIGGQNTVYRTTKKAHSIIEQACYINRTTYIYSLPMQWIIHSPVSYYLFFRFFPAAILNICR